VRLRAAEARSDLPFEKLVDEVAPSRSRAVPPLFQAALAARPGGGLSFDLPGVELAPLPAGTGTAKWDLTLFVDSAASSEIRGSDEPDADLFDTATVHRWMGWLGRLLAALDRDPAQAVAALPLLSAAERFQLVGEWNATA